MTPEQKTLARELNCRQADKPSIMPACKNCKHFTYTASDRMGASGYYEEKIGKRCTLNDWKTTSNTLCDLHEFRHHDHRDV